MGIEGADRERYVVWQPRPYDAVAEERFHRLPAGRGHVRDYDRRFGIGRLQPLHERNGSACFADRNRVNPVHRAGDAATIAPEPFPDTFAVPRLTPAAPPQP